MSYEMISGIRLECLTWDMAARVAQEMTDDAIIEDEVVRDYYDL
jgi:hypothetical protein